MRNLIKLIKLKISNRISLWKKEISNITNKPDDLDDLQKKGVELFIKNVKHNKSKLKCSFISKERHIERDGVLIIISNQNSGYIMTIIDSNVNNSINCYELHIPDRTSNNIINLYDEEIERRLTVSKNSKKDIISRDLDILLSESE